MGRLVAVEITLSLPAQTRLDCPACIGVDENWNKYSYEPVEKSNTEKLLFLGESCSKSESAEVVWIKEAVDDLISAVMYAEDIFSVLSQLLTAMYLPTIFVPVAAYQDADGYSSFQV